MTNSHTEEAYRHGGTVDFWETEMKIYYASHNLRRSNICTADADAICDRVNALTASNGDSIYKERVQKEIDYLADEETQKLFKIEISEQEIEVEE